MRILLVALCLVALCLAACSPQPVATGPSSSSSAPSAAIDDLSGEWRLVEMNGQPAPQTLDPDDFNHPITMTVGDFSFRAQSQCIAIWRRYERQGERLVVTPLNPGGMCARGLSPWETEFGRTLSAVTDASRTDGMLRLRGPAGGLAFEPAPPAPRESFAGRWRLRFVHGAAPPAGEMLEITVTPDRITANACVFAGWRYRQDGRLLEVTPLQQSVCERTLTPFEQRFSAFMPGLNRATVIDRGALILDSASEQFEFRKVD